MDSIGNENLSRKPTHSKKHRLYGFGCSSPDSPAGPTGRSLPANRRPPGVDRPGGRGSSGRRRRPADDTPGLGERRRSAQVERHEFWTKNSGIFVQRNVVFGGIGVSFLVVGALAQVSWIYELLVDDIWCPWSRAARLEVRPCRTLWVVRHLSSVAFFAVPISRQPS